MPTYFGIRNDDGTITAAMQYAVNAKLLSLLKKHFTTETSVRELINYALWDRLCNEKQYESIKREGLDVFGTECATRYAQRTVTELHGVYLLADKRYAGATPVVYRSLFDLRANSNTIVYLYGPQCKQWVRYNRML